MSPMFVMDDRGVTAGVVLPDWAGVLWLPPVLVLDPLADAAVVVPATAWVEPLVATPGEVLVRERVVAGSAPLGVVLGGMSNV